MEKNINFTYVIPLYPCVLSYSFQERIYIETFFYASCVLEIMASRDASLLLVVGLRHALKSFIISCLRILYRGFNLFFENDIFEFVADKALNIDSIHFNCRDYLCSGYFIEKFYSVLIIYRNIYCKCASFSNF